MKRKFKKNDRVRLLIPELTLSMGTVLHGFFNDATVIYVVQLDDGFISPAHNEEINRAVFHEGILQKIPRGIDSRAALLLHDLNEKTRASVAKTFACSTPWTGILRGGKFPAQREIRGIK